MQNSCINYPDDVIIFSHGRNKPSCSLREFLSAFQFQSEDAIGPITH